MGLLQNIQNFIINYGILGLFGGSFLGSLIFFPAPLELITIVAAARSEYNPLHLGTAMTVGSILGGCINYLIGYCGYKVFIKKRDMENVKTWIDKWGTPIVFIASLFPLQFDVLSVVVGILRMNFVYFLIMSSMGKGIKFFLLAYTGSTIWTYLGIK